jgi:hypothetical protein
MNGKQMNSDDQLRLAALQIKQLQSHGTRLEEHLLQAAIDQNPEEAKAHFKNICATVGIGLFERVDTICRMLDLSKRQFVEMALIDLCEKSDSVIMEVKPFPIDEVEA